MAKFNLADKLSGNTTPDKKFNLSSKLNFNYEAPLSESSKYSSDVNVDTEDPSAPILNAIGTLAATPVTIPSGLLGSLVKQGQKGAAGEGLNYKELGEDALSTIKSLGSKSNAPLAEVVSEGIRKGLPEKWLETTGGQFLAEAGGVMSEAPLIFGLGNKVFKGKGAVKPEYIAPETINRISLATEGISKEVPQNLLKGLKPITPENISEAKGAMSLSSKIRSALSDETGSLFPKIKEGETLGGAISESTSKMKTELYDRYTPIKDLVKSSKLSAESDPYIAARNYAGHAGKIENRLDDLRSVLKPNKDILPDLKQYALLDRYQELAERGIEKFPNNLNADKIVSQKAAIESKLGEQGMARLNSALTGIRSYNDRLLVEARDAGIISKQSFDAIKAKNEKYIPLQRLDYLSEQADTISRGSDSFSVASQGIIKGIKGSEKAVVDPIESMVRNTYRTINLIERNKVARKIADLSSLDEFKGVVQKAEGAVPFGMEKISVFKNGVKEEYAVPKNVGQALKGLNEKDSDLVTKWASKSAAALRAGATSLNVGFLPSNAIRDFQTATVVSRVGFTPVDWLKGFSEAIKKGDDYKAFLESGGSSGFFESQKSLPKTVKKLTENKGVRIAKTVLNPIELLRKTGETIELAPRLGVFKRSLSKGLSETEAAFNARNATVDFSKAGNTMKVLNQWVPFLNARLQGTSNMFSAIKRNPVSSALKLGAIVGAPTVATYVNNTKNYPEIWNDISETDKRNNFIIIYGNKLDRDGNPTQVVKIPKGDAKIFSNPLESFLDYLFGKDPKSLSQLALEVGSDISPISFEDKGKFSAGAVLSGVLPPTVKGLAEGFSNKNFYTGYDIVPQSMMNASPKEQYDHNTSLLAKELGKFLNWSPKKIDNFISTQFGGFGKQITSPTTAGDKIKKRFVGAYGGQIAQNMADEARISLQNQTDAKLKLKRQAQDFIDKFGESNPEEAANAFDDISKSNPALAKKIIDLKEKNDLGFTNADYVIQELQVENGERAKFLTGQFNKLKSPEDKAEFWDDLVKKKLITNKVAKQMSDLI